MSTSRVIAQPDLARLNDTAGNRRERGIALILVIWMVALLSVVAMVAAGSARTDLQIARNLLDGAKVRSLAEGGVWWMIDRLLDRDAATLERADGTATRLLFDGNSIEIAIQDEGGKIDVNVADAVLLASLCRVVGLGAEAEAIADGIVRYREQGRGDSSAETTRQAFNVIEELRLVPGIDPQRYARILPFVTVYTGDGHINPRTAPREVIMALPGVMPQQAEAYLRERVRTQAGSEATGLPPGLAGAALYLSASLPQIITITATAQGTGSTKSVREAVVDLAATQGRPFRVIAWHRGFAEETTDAAPGR